MNEYNRQMSGLLKSSIAKEENKKKAQVIIVDDADEVQRRIAQLEKAMESVEALIAENSRLSAMNESLKCFTAKFCDEQEGIFATNGELASPEIANDYLVAASYLRIHFGRTVNYVDAVNDWLDTL